MSLTWPDLGFRRLQDIGKGREAVVGQGVEEPVPAREIPIQGG